MLLSGGIVTKNLEDYSRWRLLKLRVASGLPKDFNVKYFHKNKYDFATFVRHLILYF